MKNNIQTFRVNCWKRRQRQSFLTHVMLFMKEEEFGQDGEVDEEDEDDDEDEEGV